ncbi:FAD/NAD(P)-binding domain-containing protein [Zopfia rhizophila CBS 207.26]|uniref:FAD/NAD(P)-binding domain-containing protein n=1 Tax=Zopfia rhizophila CBS 207.26 TaxID=1314779 RepID=A0A6A6EFR4_9PEZI|nr:FAD/NAD(P)-binding domain-containing protein [Zopfia rhizophila CBS 207.26]
MAQTEAPLTWKRGFATPSDDATWEDESFYRTEDGDIANYSPPASHELETSLMHNRVTDDKNVLRTWPSIYNGTQAPQEIPNWWKPQPDVDVLICGAGPFGLEIAVSLARQGVTFRIVDKADAPCLSGKADAVQPRALELLNSWGLAQEMSEEGPILNSTVLFRNGEKLFHGLSSQCDSNYRGIHVITQGQVEKVYIRDLLRHQAMVERCTVVDKFHVQPASDASTHPVTVTLKNVRTAEEETVRAKYLVGADGAGSKIREQLGIPFDGLATDCFWAIMDCRWKTDYPHILGFGIVISEEHGGVIIIPREQGFTRIYTQITGEKARKLQERRQARRNASAVGETRIDDHGITPEEVLVQLNLIMAPYKVDFASQLSWFAVWKVNERVARNFSSPDQRVHIGGDAGHVHSVLGAFGLNSSIYDAANLGWKLGLSIRNAARPEILLPTYDQERRLFANRVIRCSGAYLRFVCNLKTPLAKLRGLGEDLEQHEDKTPELDGTSDGDKRWLASFFSKNAMFIIGMETPIIRSAICEAAPLSSPSSSPEPSPYPQPTTVAHGVRAPNSRVCFTASHTSYLYETMKGADRFHILLFGSNLLGPVRLRLAAFSQKALAPGGFFHRFGGAARFNLVLVLKALPHEREALLAGEELKNLRDNATVVYDDRVPYQDAHYWYGANHARGAVVIVRPDLWVGTSAWPEDVGKVEGYFGGFLVEA